ncbi:2-hydroxyacid dehydrogenase [Nakamurella leprariae]|uniref:2-hydroxyacid dehydrogenase n=1 Tax=Nakamurella leprariae TaxID=2803911 RepID=A0A938YBJ4_9ACTN|nr:2-hydroxyacid dehydrogenase [Nakamurella leprariae]MBM9469486.1 2-hydroxyacid dehydrogenase [Nakamurella leprariae]
MTSADHPRVLVLTPPADGLRETLGRHLDDVADVRMLPDRDPATFHRELAEADVVIGDWTGQFWLAAAEAAIGTRVRFVQQPSAGVDTIDLAAWAERSVPVANCAGANAQSVAEWAVGAALALERRFLPLHQRMVEGGWPAESARGIVDVAARRVGIIGMGAIGRRIGEIFAAIGSPVAFWNRSPRLELPWPARSLPELAATTDILVVAVPLQPETRGLVSADLLASLPAGAVLVNIARGPVVDEPALIAALQDGRLAGAGLDVFTTEPLETDSPLRTLPNVLLNPHVAGSSTTALAAVVQATAENVRRAVLGEPVRWVTNGVPDRVAIGEQYC